MQANTFLYNLTNSKKNVVLNSSNEFNKIMKYIGGDSILYRNIYVQNQNNLDYYGRIYENGNTMNLESQNISLNGNVNFSNQSFITLSDAPNINWNTKGIINNAIVTLTLTTTGNTRDLNINGAVNGTSGVLIVKQDNVGGKLINLPANSKIVNNGNTSNIISLDPNSVNTLTFIYDGSHYLWNYGKNYA